MTWGGEGQSREGLLEDRGLPGSVGHTGLRGMGGGTRQALGSGSAATSLGSPASKISLIPEHCPGAWGPVESLWVFGEENVEQRGVAQPARDSEHTRLVALKPPGPCTLLSEGLLCRGYRVIDLDTSLGTSPCLILVLLIFLLKTDILKYT